jgi:hypothetical protein
MTPASRSHARTCGCGAPVTDSHYFCPRCRAALENRQPLTDTVTMTEHQHEPVTESELREKLNAMSDSEWGRYFLIGLPSRLQ